MHLIYLIQFWQLSEQSHWCWICLEASSLNAICCCSEDDVYHRGQHLDHPFLVLYHVHYDSYQQLSLLHNHSPCYPIPSLPSLLFALISPSPYSIVVCQSVVGRMQCELFVVIGWDLAWKKGNENVSQPRLSVSLTFDSHQRHTTTNHKSPCSSSQTKCRKGGDLRGLPHTTSSVNLFAITPVENEPLIFVLSGLFLLTDYSSLVYVIDHCCNTAWQLTTI